MRYLPGIVIGALAILLGAIQIAAGSGGWGSWFLLAMGVVVLVRGVLQARALRRVD